MAAKGRARAVRPKRRTAPRNRHAYLAPILERNLFDPDAAGRQVVADGDVEADRRTDLDVRLLATMVAEPEEYSSALIAEGKKGGKARGYGIGDELLGEAVITRIEQRRVILRRHDGTVEYLAMSEEDRPRKRSSSSADEGEGVEKVGENRFVVDRSVVEDALSNIDKLAGQVRAVPHRVPGGGIDGFRLSAIRRGSLFDKLGVKNGDIVHSVNGMELTGPDAALKAYNSLMNETSFTFEVTRRGQRQTFEYEIR